MLRQCAMINCFVQVNENTRYTCHFTRNRYIMTVKVRQDTKAEHLHKFFIHILGTLLLTLPMRSFETTRWRWFRNWNNILIRLVADEGTRAKIAEEWTSPIEPKRTGLLMCMSRTVGSTGLNCKRQRCYNSIIQSCSFNSPRPCMLGPLFRTCWTNSPVNRHERAANSYEQVW